MVAASVPAMITVCCSKAVGVTSVNDSASLGGACTAVSMAMTFLPGPRQGVVV
ncbi:hypothetical protein ACFFX0_04940 [Citricoccus parietis]|uniref:Uncharacterized protein n=1 Tax=Citricoccus parietis TaxID=592307 RepID=A0ABV5FV56_9MICC